MFATTFLLSSTLAIESSFVMLFGTICPDHINQSFWSAGMLSGLGDTFGRALGNAELTAFLEIDGKKATTFWLYCINFVVYLFFVIITFATYRLYELRTIIKVDSTLVDLKAIQHDINSFEYDTDRLPVSAENLEINSLVPIKTRVRK